jgi:hypothetical protein
MALVRGPFDITWGGNTLTNIEEIKTDYSVDSSDYKTVQHQTFELDGATKASVTLTFLASDVPALSVVLPQYHVSNGGILSTGETVSDAGGAIDIAAASCNQGTIYNDLFINSCANPGQIFRLINARTRVDSVDFDDKVRKVMVKFLGEPDPGQANVQFYKEGSVTAIS